VEQQIHPTPETQGGGKPDTSCATERQADLLLGFRQSVGAPSPRGEHGGETLGEDFARTGSLVTEKASHVEEQATAIPCPGKIRERATIATVDARRQGRTLRTCTGRLLAHHAEGDQRRISKNRGVLDSQQCRVRQKVGNQIHHVSSETLPFN
jgi:hypothetical protein